MDKINYRLEGLKREADDIAKYLKENIGLMNCDLEIIGAILFIKYKGEDKRISKLFENTNKLLEEAENFLKSLEKK